MKMDGFFFMIRSQLCKIWNRTLQIVFRIRYIKQFIRIIKIKEKIMGALILVCLFSIICVSTINLLISSRVITENSQNMADDIILQISYNLDERVGQFENSSYNLTTNPSVKKLLDLEQSSCSVYLNYGLSDYILQNPILYNYTSSALIQNYHEQTFFYYKNSSVTSTSEKMQDVLNVCKKTVSRIYPTAWIRVNQSVYFVRLIIENSTYRVKGILCLQIDPSFFEFINENKGVLSDENLIVLNSENEVLFHSGYDLRDAGLASVLKSRADNQLRNYKVRIKQDKCIVAENVTGQKNWRVLGIIKISVLLRQNRVILLYVLLIALMTVSISVVLTRIIVQAITRNITIIERGMGEVEKGNFKVRIRPAAYDEIGMLGLRYNYFILQMEKLIQTIAEETNAKQQAEFQALEAQINPHFLYNTLGSIKWYANSKGQAEIEKMVDSLILLLKSSIKKANSFQTVREEMDLIRSYINLEQMRFGDVFQTKFLIEEEVNDCLILGFLLQPFVENSIYHGMDISKSGGAIWIRAFRRNDRLVLQVEDNGCGFSKERLCEIMEKPEKKYRGFNSIGIRIVNERLKAYYHTQYQLKINSEVGVGTLIEIELPLKTTLGSEAE